MTPAGWRAAAPFLLVVADGDVEAAARLEEGDPVRVLLAGALYDVVSGMGVDGKSPGVTHELWETGACDVAVSVTGVEPPTAAVVAGAD